jgi:DNA-binding response OmpR family regulator
MEGDTLDGKPSVLIVDSSAETCEVLETALNRRGVRTFTASHAIDGLELGRLHQPDLIVLDLEVDDVNLEQSIPPYWVDFEDRNTPVILLGTLRRNQTQIRGSEIVRKPYHFGPLIRRIEELLGEVKSDE